MNENESTLIGNNIVVNSTNNADNISESATTNLPQVSIVRSGSGNGSGSVTQVNTGVGLVGGPITTTGEVKAKLKSETPSSLASGTITQSTNRQYAVGVDKDGYLSVNVPWSSQGAETVTQNPTTTNASYELLFSQSADNLTHTEQTRKSATLTYNPSTKALTTGGAINGYTLAAAAEKGVDTSISDSVSSSNLPTTDAVKRYIEDQGYSSEDTTYIFTGGTNGFTATSSKGTVQNVTVIPNIANNITGTGTSGSIAQFDGANHITNGPTFGGDTTLFLRNDGAWDTPQGDLNVQADWAEEDSSSDAYIQNKPSIPSNTSDLINDSGYITEDSDILGNAATASSLEISRSITLSEGASATPTYFNGSSNISIPVTDVKDSYVTWGGKELTDNRLSPGDMGSIDEFGHNKLAYLNPGCLEVAYSVDGGETWQDSGLTDAQKIKMVTTTGPMTYSGGSTAATEENVEQLKLRIRLACCNSTGTRYIYTAAKKILFNVTDPGANATLTMRYRTIANYLDNIDTWTNVSGTYSVRGGSGWNSIPFIYTFGGFDNQTDHIGQFEFIFSNTQLGTWGSKKVGVGDIRLIGASNWITPSELARAGHIYTLDENKNATFLAGLTASNITTTGNITTSGGDILLTKNADTGGQQVKWSVGTNDYARIYGGATASNTGYLEIATGDDHIEPIYVRQYQGTFSGGYISKEAKLLDENGNTSFPGALTANTIDATKLSGAIPSGVTAVTQTAGDNSTKLATTAFVTKAISDLPEPMIFKGTVASDGSGTITSLPTASASNEGWTYKVAKAGTYASKAAKLGDTFICAKTGTSTYEWVLIPSGDDIDVTQVSAGAGLNTSGPDSSTDGGNITTTGTLYLTKSGVTAGTYRSVTTDKYGRITAGTNPTTLSGYGITDAKIQNGVIQLGSNTLDPVLKTGSTMTGPLILSDDPVTESLQATTKRYVDDKSTSLASLILSEEEPDVVTHPEYKNKLWLNLTNSAIYFFDQDRPEDEYEGTNEWVEVEGFKLSIEWDDNNQLLNEKLDKIRADLDDFKIRQMDGDPDALPEPIISINEQVDTKINNINTEILALHDTDNQLDTKINSTKTSLESMIQTVDDKYTGYLVFTDKGTTSPQFTVTTPVSSQKVNITNTALNFKSGDNNILTIDTEKASSPYIEAQETLAIGDFAFVKKTNGHVSLKKIK